MSQPAPPPQGFPGNPWQPPAWQPPTGPPAAGPSRVARVLIGIGLLAVGLVAGGIGGYAIGSHRSQISADVSYGNAAASGCSAGKSVPDPSAAAPAGSALAARLLPRPQGAVPVTGEQTGVLSLNDYLGILYTDDQAYERGRLTARCFQTVVRGYWQTSAGAASDVFLIEFATAADAHSYVISTEQSDSTAAGATIKSAVSGVADGMVVGGTAVDKDGNTLVRAFGDYGNVAILIHVFYPVKPDPAAAVQTLTAQYQRLTATS
jgi:hypothetical protein